MGIVGWIYSQTFKKRKGEITSLMNMVEAELIGIMSEGDLERVNLDKVGKALSEYYNKNPSIWSDFCELWEKACAGQNINPASYPSTEKGRQAVWDAIANATANPAWDIVKKGMVAHLRISNCREFFEQQLKRGKETKKVRKSSSRYKNPNGIPEKIKK